VSVHVAMATRLMKDKEEEVSSPYKIKLSRHSSDLSAVA
jgi:hypothetical protein